MRGERKRRLQKLRSEMTERSFAHLYETGGMRRVHLRGRNNILKRLLVHGAAFNLSLMLRQTLGVGKPRRLQGIYLETLTQFARLFLWLWTETTDGGEGVGSLCTAKYPVWRQRSPADRHNSGNAPCLAA